MDMSGSQVIHAPREAVYAALNDVDILRQCIPGCEEINKTSDTEMVAKVTLRIGPVKASFGGNVTLSDLDPPNGYTITGEGSGGIAGFAKGSAAVKLEAVPEGTLLHYEVKAEIGGKLAQLGSRLIDSTAKKLAGEFFEKFSEVVGGPAPQTATEDGVEEISGEAPRKGWLGRMFGTTSAALFFLAASGGVCCLKDHQHEADQPVFAICSNVR